MGEIVNLRLARKRAARLHGQETAQANRAASSIPGRVRKAARQEGERAALVLDGHRLEPKPDRKADGDAAD